MTDNTAHRDSLWQKKILFFLISQNLSIFGSSVVGFAVVTYITLETSSGVWMMLATICSLAPQMLISLFSGVWADRYNRKHLIMMADGFVAAATLLLAVFFVIGFQNLTLVLIVLTFRSLGNGIQTPAVSALYPQLVKKEHLTKVQGLNQSINAILTLLAPVVGGIALDLFGIVGSYFIDVVTALLSIFIMSCIKVDKIAAARTAESMWSDIRNGINYVRNHKHLYRIVLCSIFGFILLTPATTLTPLLIERSFGNEVWRLTVNQTVFTVTAMLGGLLISLKGNFRNKALVMGFCLVGFGVAFGLAGLSWSFIVYLVFISIAGFFLPVIMTALNVYIQEITSQEMLGRVFSLIQLISSGAVPVAILFFGPLADVVRVEAIIMVSGALLALVGAIYAIVEKDAEKEIINT